MIILLTSFLTFQTGDQGVFKHYESEHVPETKKKEL